MTMTKELMMTAEELRALPSVTGELYYPDGETELPDDLTLTIATDLDGVEITYFADGWDDVMVLGPLENTPELSRQLIRYDYRDISADGRQWVNDLRGEDGFPRIDNLCEMTSDERDTLAAYLRDADSSLSGDDMDFSSGVADEIDSL